MHPNRTPNVICAACGKAFWVNAYELRIRKYCSRSCAGKGRRVQSGLTDERIRRFWSYVDTSGGDTQCWNWTGPADSHGYGFLTIDKRHWRATRISTQIAFGPLPEGHIVCHHCDNPPCVNPRHLYYGTPQDNTDDMVARGRSKFFGGRVFRGDDSGRAKLTSEQVIELRREFGRSPFNVSERARQLGVAQPVLRNAIIGVNWKHLPSVDELKDAA